MAAVNLALKTIVAYRMSGSLYHILVYFVMFMHRTILATVFELPVGWGGLNHQLFLELLHKKFLHQVLSVALVLSAPRCVFDNMLKPL